MADYLLLKARKNARFRLREVYPFLKARRSPGFRVGVVYLPCKDKENWKIQAANGLPAPKSKKKCIVQAESGLSAPKSKGKPGAQAEAALCSARLRPSCTFLSSRPGASPAHKSKERRTAQAGDDLHRPQSSAQLPLSPLFLFLLGAIRNCCFVSSAGRFLQGADHKRGEHPSAWGVTGQRGCPGASSQRTLL